MPSEIKPLIDLTKYGQIAYEFYCLNNNIPPSWEEIDSIQQESWKKLAHSILIEYRSDAVRHKLIDMPSDRNF